MTHKFGEGIDRMIVQNARMRGHWQALGTLTNRSRGTSPNSGRESRMLLVVGHTNFDLLLRMI
jgi:hypothetical protein